MIENEFLLFRQFILKDEALALVKKLDEGGIEAILGDNKAPFDVTFSGNTSMGKSVSFRVHLNPIITAI